jgi:hypothetical protein
MSTSWWKGLGQSRPAAHQGACGGGEVPFGGRIGRNTPRFGPRIPISWSKTLSKFPKFRASGPQNPTRRRACEPWFQHVRNIIDQMMYEQPKPLCKPTPGTATSADPAAAVLPCCQQHRSERYHKQQHKRDACHNRIVVKPDDAIHAN